MICKLLKTIECECIVSKIYPFLNNCLLCGDDNGTIIVYLIYIFIDKRFITRKCSNCSIMCKYKKNK